MRVMEILLHVLRRPNHAGNFARQFDAGAFAKTETADVFVKFLLAEHERELGRADVARLNENVLHAQLAVRLVIVQRPCRRSSRRRSRKRSSCRAAPCVRSTPPRR
jgi:hypothetical protein